MSVLLLILWRIKMQDLKVARSSNWFWLAVLEIANNLSLGKWLLKNDLCKGQDKKSFLNMCGLEAVWFSNYGMQTGGGYLYLVMLVPVVILAQSDTVCIVCISNCIGSWTEVHCGVLWNFKEFFSAFVKTNSYPRNLTFVSKHMPFLQVTKEKLSDY